MEHTIEPSEDRTHVVLKIVGDLTGKEMMQCILEAHAVGKGMGVDRYLVDATEARNTDTVVGNYNFAYSDMRGTEGVDTKARVAALVSPGDHSHDFAETAMRNAGYFLTLFTDADAARDYLTEE